MMALFNKPDSEERLARRIVIAILLVLLVLLALPLLLPSVPEPEPFEHTSRRKARTWESSGAVLAALAEHKSMLEEASALMMRDISVYRVDAGALGYVAVHDATDYEAHGGWTPEELRVIDQAFSVLQPYTVDMRGGLLFDIFCQEEPRISGHCVLIYLPDPADEAARRKALQHPTRPNFLVDTGDPHWLMVMRRPYYTADKTYDVEALTRLLEENLPAFEQMTELVLSRSESSPLYGKYALFDPYYAYDDPALSPAERDALLNFWLEFQLAGYSRLEGDRGVEFLFRRSGKAGFIRLYCMTDGSRPPLESAVPTGLSGWYVQHPKAANE